MIKVYCLDSGDCKMWAAAEDIKEASDVMLGTYDTDALENGYEIKPLTDAELDDEVGEEGEDEKLVRTSWRKIINDPNMVFPCIIGESYQSITISN